MTTHASPRRPLAASLLALALGLAACGGGGPSTFPMKRAQTALASDGSVSATVDANKNTSLTVTVKHLTPPDRVAPGATVYVVWARAAGGAAPQNLGALSLDGELNGSLHTITPLTELDVLVTAEASASVAAPSSEPVLSARVDRRGE